AILPPFETDAVMACALRQEAVSNGQSNLRLAVAHVGLGWVEPSVAAQYQYPHVAVAQKHQRGGAPDPFVIESLLRAELWMNQSHQLAGVLLFDAFLQALRRQIQCYMRVVQAAAGEYEQGNELNDRGQGPFAFRSRRSA